MENMHIQRLDPHLKSMLKGLILSLLILAPLSSVAETVDTLVCPRSIDRFISTSKSTVFNMEDLVKVKTQMRTAYEDLYFFMLDKNKSKSVLEEIKNIDVTIQGLKTKEKRANDNYNKMAMEMGSYMTKTRRCWGNVSTTQKPQVNMLFDYILKEKRLSTFKECVKAMDETNETARKKYLLALDFMNKKREEKSVVAEGKVAGEKLKSLKEKEQKICKGMNVEGHFREIIQVYFLSFSTEERK